MMILPPSLQSDADGSEGDPLYPPSPSASSATSSSSALVGLGLATSSSPTERYILRLEQHRAQRRQQQQQQQQQSQHQHARYQRRSRHNQHNRSYQSLEPSDGAYHIDRAPASSFWFARSRHQFQEPPSDQGSSLSDSIQHYTGDYQDHILSDPEDHHDDDLDNHDSQDEDGCYPGNRDHYFQPLRIDGITNGGGAGLGGVQGQQNSWGVGYPSYQNGTLGLGREEDSSRNDSNDTVIDRYNSIQGRNRIMGSETSAISDVTEDGQVAATRNSFRCDQSLSIGRRLLCATGFLASIVAMTVISATDSSITIAPSVLWSTCSLLMGICVCYVRLSCVKTGPIESPSVAVMKHFERVHLVGCDSNLDGPASLHQRASHECHEKGHHCRSRQYHTCVAHAQVKVLSKPTVITSFRTKQWTLSPPAEFLDLRACSICMSDFPIHAMVHDETKKTFRLAIAVDEDDEELGQQQCYEPPHMVRTSCGHVFHENCLGSWVTETLRNKPVTVCPLCRRELGPVEWPNW